MRRTATILASLALLAGTLLLITPAAGAAAPAVSAKAAAGQRDCITRTEFRRIARGQTITRVRQIVGATGRVRSSSTYSDGDRWVTVAFRQCGRTWRRSFVSVSFQSTEREVYVRNDYCYWEDYDYDGYDDEYVCEDYGWWETRYVNPIRVTSKSAYWS